METDTDTDSDFESVEEGSEYFSVTDGDEMQLDWDGEDYVDYDEQSGDRSVGDGNIPVKTFSSKNASRRSNRIRIKKRKEALPLVNTMYFERLKRTKVGKIKIYESHTNSKSYSEPSRIHRPIHTRKISHNCSICSKSFYSASHLEVHIRTHTEEKPHKCSTCSQSFSQTGYLNQHMRIHTGEKPYQCLTCSKSFSRLFNLKSTHSSSHR